MPASSKHTPSDIGTDLKQAKRFTVLESLGPGPYGEIYVARVDRGPLVALHVLDTADRLEAFRAAAEVRSALQDRALADVYPIFQLGETWVMVADAVRGAPLSSLLEEGSVPPRVALEIVQELARLLELRGADETLLGPLVVDTELVWITPEGTVRWVESGLTSPAAPEREDPRDTVNELGRLLHELLTGTAIRRDAVDPLTTASRVMVTRTVARLVAMSAAMQSLKPEDRPSLGELQQRCQALRAKCAPPDLAVWAAREVPQHALRIPTASASADGLLGQTLVVRGASRAGGAPWLALAAVVLAAVVLAGIALAAVALAL